MKRILYYLLHELLHWYANKYPAVRLQQWYKNAIIETLEEWCEVKTQQTMIMMDDVSIDVGPSGVTKPVYEEKPSDEVEGLPEMSLSATWRRD